MIFQDYSGETLYSSAGCLTNLHSALHAEPQAAAEALTIASKLGMGKVILETDTMELKQSMEVETTYMSPLCVIFEDLMGFARLNFLNFKVVYCPRTCNVVAHTLSCGQQEDKRAHPIL